MSSMGLQTWLGRPLPSLRNSSKSSLTESWAFLMPTQTASTGSSRTVTLSSSAASSVP